MPEQAVELTVSVHELVDEGRESDIAQIWKIISEKGFQATHHGDEVDADALYFQPFEETQENKDLIKECVEEIESKFSDFEVVYSFGRNRDRTKLAGRLCSINIKT